MSKRTSQGLENFLQQPHLLFTLPPAWKSYHQVSTMLWLWLALLLDIIHRHDSATRCRSPTGPAPDQDTSLDCRVLAWVHIHCKKSIKVCLGTRLRNSFQKLLKSYPKFPMQLRNADKYRISTFVLCRCQKHLIWTQNTRYS